MQLLCLYIFIPLPSSPFSRTQFVKQVQDEFCSKGVLDGLCIGPL